MSILRAPIVAALAIAASAVAPDCQDPAPERTPTYRIGVFFWHDSPNDRLTFRGIRRGLEQAGIDCAFVEHQADSDPERAEQALASLRNGGCDLVFAMGTQAALLAKKALTGVPVVFAAVSNPVASGVVPSWDGSLSNLCGASNWIPPQNVLDVFRLAVPGLTRLGMLRSADAGVVSEAELSTMRAWLAKNGEPPLELIEAVAPDADGIARAVDELLGRNIEAIWIPIDITIYGNLPAVEKALGGRRIPLLTTAAAAKGGAVAAAIADYTLHGRRAAAIAALVLRGGKRPRDLPIDRMTGSIVVANLTAAQKLGLELPLSLLVLADELIDTGAPR